MAPRRVAGGRRRLPRAVVLVIAGFLAVTIGVIWRRSAGLSNAREQQALERRRDALIARQRFLESEVREASSRRRLAPVVEAQLGMRVPTASQLMYLPRPTRTPEPPDAPQ